MKKKNKKIVEFQEEIKKPMLNNRGLFLTAIEKQPEELTPDEVRALIFRMSQLSDDERYRFRHILVLENLTEEEEKHFHRIFVDKAFGQYFPKQKDVEEHYKTHFTAGRIKENQNGNSR